MSDKFNVLIFDCYNVFLRWESFKHEQISTVDGKKVHVEGILGFFEAINTYILKYGTDDCKCYFLMDNADTMYERKQISELYKNDRNLQYYQHRELDFIELILHYYKDNSYLFRVPKYEADDYVPNILRCWIKKDDNVLLISEDLDWSKFISNNVSQYMKHKIFTPSLFEETFGYKPTVSNVTFDKVFYGDDSDNIIGTLPNLSRNFFKMIIEKYNEPKSFIQSAIKGELNFLDMGWRMKIEKEQENILKNWDIVTSIHISDEDLCTYKYSCSFKKNKLFIIYSALDVLGKFDKRIKNDVSQNGIFDMLNGVTLNRKK